jgi:hypothetical protein
MLAAMTHILSGVSCMRWGASASRTINACTVLLQGLIGSVPTLGVEISSKITSVSLQNTSLVQCNASHLVALRGLAVPGEVT